MKRVPLTEHELCLRMFDPSFRLVHLVGDYDNRQIVSSLLRDFGASLESLVVRLDVVGRIHDDEEISRVQRQSSHGWEDVAASGVEDLKFDVLPIVLDHSFVHVFDRWRI